MMDSFVLMRKCETLQVQARWFNSWDLLSAVGLVSVSRSGNELLSFRTIDTKGNSLQDARLWGGRASA